MGTGHQIAMALRAAYLAMHRRTDAALAEAGVTADQFVVLAVLAEADGVTQQVLARRASSDANTVGAMLSLLEGRGLVARERHPTDGRARVVVLTPEGRRTFAKLVERSSGVREGLEGLFGPDEARLLIEMLGRVAGEVVSGQ